MPIENTKKNKELRKAKTARRIMLHVPYYVRLGYDLKTQYRNHRKTIRQSIQMSDDLIESDFADLT